MINYTINEIAAALGLAQDFEPDVHIEQLLTDSRKVYFPGHALFFALKGGNHNGHAYIPALYQKGVRNFVVGEMLPTPSLPGANFLHVKDTVAALQAVAAFHRHHFDIPVIGITGSNGKTIVKELLFQLLSADHNIVRSPKSYNSQIGVPLSVWQMSELDDLAIFEAGISKAGEMKNLQPVIDPTIGIFTFIGEAHGEGFVSTEEKIREKLQLFIHSDILFYCKDEKLLDEQINQFAEQVNPTLQTFSWGFAEGCSLCILSQDKRSHTTFTHYRYEGKDFTLDIPFTDDASIHNALTCCAVMLYLKIPYHVTAQRMLQLKAVGMRLELIQGNNNCSIINDGYSADIDSLKIALDFLFQQQQHEKRTLVLSDILQSGYTDTELYTIIASIVSEKQPDRFIGIGPQLKAHAPLFPAIADMVFYNSTDEMLRDIPALNFSNETILLKGARIFEFERISNLLEQKTHQTVLEVSLGALRRNLDVYRGLLSPGVKVMAMVKAFGYGSGSFEVASLLQQAGVHFLAVAYADEAVELRKAGIRLPIMVMNVDMEAFESIVHYSLQPELYSFNILEAFQSFLHKKDILHYPVHIKLDTGMHRLGFELKDMDGLSALLAGNSSFDIISVFSHLVASDDPALDDFSKEQAERFQLMCAILKSSTGQTFIQHLANTSAIARMPGMQFGMVRLGIGLYGVDVNPDIQSKLEPVATLKTTIAQLRNVKAGDTVGYSRKGKVESDAVVATIRIGYADGYRRALGNGKGYMLVKGQQARVIGNVCMDMTMLDVTGIDCLEEDEVIVFGQDLPVYSVAAAAGTISYEVLTSISQRVKRVYFEE